MSAIETAARLDEIGFPEFTHKLIDDTFQAILSSTISQLGAYKDFVSALSKSLTAYINDTKDDVGFDEILLFLQKALPSSTNSSGTAALPEPATNAALDPTDTLPAAADLAKLNSALEVAGTPSNNHVGAAATMTQLFDAVATRITANKYDMLQAMAKMGLLRLVVTDGVVETKLTFHTYESQFSIQTATDFKNTAVNAGLAGGFGSTSKGPGRGGGFLKKVFNISGSVSYSRVRIQTNVSTQTASSGTDINIMGRVEVRFKTDYAPLGS